MTPDPDDAALLHEAIDQLTGSGQGDCRPLARLPMHAVPPVRRCRKILYTTKIQWLATLTDGLTNLPDDIAVIWHYGPLTLPQGTLLQGMLGALSAPMSFVGDLDPLDLASFGTVAKATSELEPVLYLGISDSWLYRCEAALVRPGLEKVCIEMDDDERNGLERLTRMAAPWGDLVGPRALALLRSGMKLELEGASNPLLYSREFCRELLERLVG